MEKTCIDLHYCLLIKKICLQPVPASVAMDDEGYTDILF